MVPIGTLLIVPVILVPIDLQQWVLGLLEYLGPEVVPITLNPKP